MIPHRPTVRAWQEPLRLGLTVVWVTTLALWSYYQVRFLHCYPYVDQNALEIGSRVLRTAAPLWAACFLHALALGLAGYALAHRPIRDRLASAIHCGQERLRTAQTYMTLCVVICLFLVNWRTLYYGAPADSGWGRVSFPLIVFHWGPTEWWPGPGILELQVFIGALGLGVVFLRVCDLVRPWRGHRRNASLLALFMLAAGLLVHWSGILYDLPSPMPREIGDLAQDDPVHRGLILGDPAFEHDARLALSRYFETYDASGGIVPWRYVQENEFPFWADADADGRATSLCEICQLPGVQLWTTRGLPLALGKGGEARGSTPTLAIEVPRGHDEVRLYDPDGEGPITAVPPGGLATLGLDADWVVLKVDFEVPMEKLVSVLEELRANEVRRVDLAVIPHGFRPLPPGRPRLTFGSGESAETYEPSPSQLPLRRYLPPPSPDARCQAVWEYWETCHEWALDEPESLPESVRILVREDWRYGKFVAVLQGAIAGGAKQIHLTLEQPAD